MNLRHAAALVFMGWYLLAPPPSLDWQHAKRPLDSLRPDARFRNGSSGVLLTPRRSARTKKTKTSARPPRRSVDCNSHGMTIRMISTQK